MDKTREKGIDGNPCVPMFLLDPAQLNSLKKPIRKIGLPSNCHDAFFWLLSLGTYTHLMHTARPKPPPLFTGLREKEREMVARRLLMQHVGIH